MQQDALFPLEAVPPRVRRVILTEFQGRRPSVQEIAQLSDRHWLATPGVGPTILERIRDLTHSPPQRDEPDQPGLTDAELLGRLQFLQDELRWIRHTLMAKAHKTARKDDSFRSQDRVSSGSSNDLSLR
jgi:hypothetical protein